MFPLSYVLEVKDTRTAIDTQWRLLFINNNKGTEKVAVSSKDSLSRINSK